MDERAHKANRVTLVGLIADVALTLFKYFAGITGRSQAMVADATHSLSDIFTDVVVLLGVRFASKPVDGDHDYGHGKIETLACTVVGLALLGVGVGIVWSALREISTAIRGDILPRPAWIAFYAAVISIASKEWLYRYTAHAGRKIDSSAVAANAWHHRSDAFSSIGTMLGIGGAIMLGERWRVLDPIAALAISFFILKIAFSISFKSLNELVEGSLSRGEKERILQAIRSVPGASNPHGMRTRKIGDKVAVDVHIEVKKSLNVAKAHDISTEVERKLKSMLGEGSFITVHVEPLE